MSEHRRIKLRSPRETSPLYLIFVLPLSLAFFARTLKPSEIEKRSFIFVLSSNSSICRALNFIDLKLLERVLLNVFGFGLVPH